MSEPSIILGVTLMDRDHAELEDLLSRVSETDDANLIQLLDEFEAEMRAHFEREEDLMRQQALPVLACHSIQHELLLEQVHRARPAAPGGETSGLRAFMADILPALLFRHINTADRVTAELILNSRFVEA